MSITLKFRGVRGSRPTHKRELLGYGGNSTCLEFVDDDSSESVIIDAGTGIVATGRELALRGNQRDFHILITHTHWDHIIGIPFFEPFYNKNNTVTFYASDTEKATFKDLFFGLRNQANLPIPASLIQATINFRTVVPDETFALPNGINVTTHQLNHQGITLGYRLEKGSASCCFITDNAPIGQGNFMGDGMQELAASDPAQFEKNFDAGMINFLRDANTVVFDTHFTDSTLKPDWGHSTPGLALDFCRKANVKRLILFHHAPEDTDNDVDTKIISVIDDANESGIEVEAAREGDQWHLDCA